MKIALYALKFVQNVVSRKIREKKAGDIKELSGR